MGFGLLVWLVQEWLCGTDVLFDAGAVGSRFALRAKSALSCRFSRAVVVSTTRDIEIGRGGLFCSTS
jgi:hypothetical protein